MLMYGLAGALEGLGKGIVADNTARLEAAKLQREEMLAKMQLDWKTTQAETDRAFKREERIEGQKHDITLLDRKLAEPEKPTSEMREYKAAVDQGFTGTFMDYKTTLRKAGATNINMGGGSDKQVFDAMNESTAAAKAAATGLNSIAEARKSLQGGAITGAFANEQLALQKIGAAIGVLDPSAIQNTETFRSAIAPQVAAMMKATVGSTQISNADREFAEKAAGGSITLDEGSILRLLDIMERGSAVVLENHRQRLDKVYPTEGGFQRERALFEVNAPQVQMQQSSGNPIIDKARAAIRAGADPEMVRKRLLDSGIDPSGL